MSVVLSVCVPTWNRASVLPQTLDSILSQVSGQGGVEVVVLDNASTDETAALLAHYEQRYGAQFRYVRHARNLGFDRNIMACVEEARGEYLAFCADDDIVLPGVYDRVLTEVEQRQPAFICLGLYPFRGVDYARRIGSRSPQTDIVFEDGKSFFKLTRLGFLSVLIMKTAYARKYLASVNLDLYCAHVDIAARIVLYQPGPFLYLGTQTVAARAPEQPAYDSITSIHLNYVSCLYRLEAEGILTLADIHEMLIYSIRGPLWRDLLRKKGLGDEKQLEAQRAQLYQYYGWHPLFRLYAGLIFRMPRAMMRWLYQVLVRLNRWIKSFWPRYNLL
jgi:glycosyltransferase involved in cell wall biosynthesis